MIIFGEMRSVCNRMCNSSCSNDQGRCEYCYRVHDFRESLDQALEVAFQSLEENLGPGGARCEQETRVHRQIVLCIFVRGRRRNFFLLERMDGREHA